jgi:hypothetical protein
MLEKTAKTLEEQNGVLSVSHNVFLTMKDGKIYKATTSKSPALFATNVVLHQNI